MQTIRLSTLCAFESHALQPWSIQVYARLQQNKLKSVTLSTGGANIPLAPSILFFDFPPFRARRNCSPRKDKRLTEVLFPVFWGRAATIPPTVPRSFHRSYLHIILLSYTVCSRHTVSQPFLAAFAGLALLGLLGRPYRPVPMTTCQKL